MDQRAKPLRVVGYLRVSTGRQVEEGGGLKVQERAIRDWAKAQAGATAQAPRLVAWFRDEGISGTNGLETRLGLADALRHLKTGKADGLVVYRLDRLARDALLQEQLLREVWQMGCRVYSTSPAEDSYLDPDAATHDPSRDLIRQVLGAVSQYERAMVRLRLRSGKERKAADGGYAGGAPRTGWVAQGRELVEDPEEQETVARIMALRAAGRSFREIVSVLDAEGRRTKRGGSWRPATVRNIALRQESA